jgi:hypothetical protein
MRCAAATRAGAAGRQPIALLALREMAGSPRRRISPGISRGASPDAAMHAARLATRHRHALRRKLTAVTRLRVFQRDGFRCVLCGNSPATDRRVRLHIDHIRALARGGSNDLNNLQTLCQQCNIGKGARTLRRMTATTSGSTVG